MNVRKFLSQYSLEPNELTNYEFKNVRRFTNLKNEYTIFDEKVIVIKSYDSRIIVLKFGILEELSKHLEEMVKLIDFTVLLNVVDKKGNKYIIEIYNFGFNYLRKLSISLYLDLGSPDGNYVAHNPYGPTSINYDIYSNKIIDKSYKLYGKAYDELSFEVAKVALEEW